MKKAMVMVAIALVLGVAGVAFAAEEAVVQPTADTVQAPETPSAPAMTADQWLAAQEIVLPGAIFAGEPCGGVFCGKFEYCCNPTCNACVPFGWGCTQEVCN